MAVNNFQDCLLTHSVETLQVILPLVSNIMVKQNQDYLTAEYYYILLDVLSAELLC